MSQHRKKVEARIYGNNVKSVARVIGMVNGAALRVRLRVAWAIIKWG